MGDLWQIWKVCRDCDVAFGVRNQPSADAFDDLARRCFINSPAVPRSSRHTE
jgi:hypothetical protein